MHRFFELFWKNKLPSIQNNVFPHTQEGCTSSSHLNTIFVIFHLALYAIKTICNFGLGSSVVIFDENAYLQKKKFKLKFVSNFNVDCLQI